MRDDDIVIEPSPSDVYRSTSRCTYLCAPDSPVYAQPDYSSFPFKTYVLTPFERKKPADKHRRSLFYSDCSIAAGKLSRRYRNFIPVQLYTHSNFQLYTVAANSFASIFALDNSRN